MAGAKSRERRNLKNFFKEIYKLMPDAEVEAEGIDGAGHAIIRISSQGATTKIHVTLSPGDSQRSYKNAAHKARNVLLRGKQQGAR